MPQLTIDLTDDAYLLLQRWAKREQLGLEDEAAQMMNRALAASLPEGLARWQELFALTGSIKGWIASALLDDDGTQFTPTERSKILENADQECDRLLSLLRATTLNRSKDDYSTSIHDRIRTIVSRAPSTQRPLADDPAYRIAVSAIQNQCLSLLADVERLKNPYQSFDGEARTVLIARLEEQCERLQNLAQSLREMP